jgi:hypothetical protein
VLSFIKFVWIRATASEEPAASVFIVISAIASIRRMKRVFAANAGLIASPVSLDSE